MITLQAHFDGERIVLDEAFELPVNVPLFVISPEKKDDGIAESAWVRAATSSDAFAFLKDPAEDIYTLEDGEPLRN